MSPKQSHAILKDMVKAMRDAPHEPFRELLDEYYQVRKYSEKRLEEYTINMKPRPRPGGRLSPSSVCGCPRAAAFKFASVPGRDVTNPTSERIFENGDWFHHKWQAICLDMELVLGRKRFRVLGIESPMTIPSLYIAGNLDVLVEIKVKGKWVKYVIDIKSINSYGFNEVLRLQRPLPSHEEQVTTYAKGMEVEWGILLYENKNDNRVETFAFSVDPGVWHRIEEWSEDVIRHLNSETIPEMHPDCASGTFLYEKCPWSQLCFGKKRKRDKQLRQLVYIGNKRWKSVDRAWKRGLKQAEGGSV